MPQTSEVFWCIFWPEMMSLLTPDPGDSWPWLMALSRVSHRLHPLQWPPADHWTWNFGSSALYWFWFGLEPGVGSHLPVSDRVKEVQGWVWRECGDPAAAANWATCATCQVWWLEKTFLLFGIIIKPLNASVLEKFKLSQKIFAPTHKKLTENIVLWFSRVGIREFATQWHSYFPNLERPKILLQVYWWTMNIE